MGQDPSLAGNIRIGNRERDAVAAVLQEAAGDGRLSMAELDDRLDAALQAKTYGDLDPLVADLSVELPSHALSSGRPRAQGPPAPGYSREDPLRLEAGMGSEKRSGVWTVPPFILIKQGMGSVKLNCLEATPAAQLIEVEVVELARQRVYAGAYAGFAEAEIMRQLLRSAGLPDSLVQRVGTRQ